jgi:hypothetical protein
MRQYRIITFLVFLASLSRLTFGGESPQPFLASLDRVAQTMTRMRLASTLLEDERRMTGSYPLADGILHPLRDVFGPSHGTPGPNEALDAWGQTLWFRADGAVQELISYGADGRADKDYEAERLYSGKHQAIVDSSDPRNDLVMKNGRFVARPFGNRSREFTTINAIFIASSSFAVDNNRYPGSATAFEPVSALMGELVPVYIRNLPALDGWGRPILYSNNGATFVLASFGEDGVQDQIYYPDLVCGLEPEEGPSPEEGGDVVQACGRFAHWPRGTEP